MRWAYVFLLLPPLASAQTAAVADSRLLNLPSPWTVGASTLEVTFTHRFTRTMQDAGGENLFGVDSPADVGIGLALGLGSRAQVELYRSSFLKEVELAGKWVALPLGAWRPWGVSLRGGAAYRGAFRYQPRWSGFIQAIVAYRPHPSWELACIGGWASDTPSLRRAGNVAFTWSSLLPRRWRVSGELVPPNPKARHGRLAWALGLSKGVGGHTFTLYLGNSRATTSDLWVGSDFPGGLRQRDARLGFNIVRRLPE